MNLSEISQIVSGLVITGRCDPLAVNVSSFEPPYDRLVSGKRDGKNDAELIASAGMSTFNTAKLAALSVPADAEMGTYLNLLHSIAAKNLAGTQLVKLGNKMLRGEDVDLSKLQEAAAMLEDESIEWMTMDEVEAESNVWIPTYWAAIDEYMWGIPKYGLIIVAAPPGTGKTSAVVKFIDKMTRNRKRVGFVSLELTKEVAKKRWLEIRPGLTPGQARYLHITDLELNLDETCASIARVVSQYPDMYAVFIDYADLLIMEENTENASKIYIQLSKLAKKIRKPIFLISQLSRNYVGGVPHVTDIRYSGLAEAAASLILLLYNPDQLFVDMGKGKSENGLPYIEDAAYIIEGKSRFGYKQGGIGAVRVNWGRAEGWGEEGEAWEKL